MSEPPTASSRAVKAGFKSSASSTPLIEACIWCRGRGMGRDYRIEYRNGYNNERPYSPGRYAGERYSPDRYSPEPQDEPRRHRSASPHRGRDRRCLALPQSHQRTSELLRLSEAGTVGPRSAVAPQSSDTHGRLRSSGPCFTAPQPMGSLTTIFESITSRSKMLHALVPTQGQRLTWAFDIYKSLTIRNLST